MRNRDRINTYLKNFRDNRGKNRKKLKERILSDPEWVRAFLQAYQDIRIERNAELHNSAAV